MQHLPTTPAPVIDTKNAATARARLAGACALLLFAAVGLAACETTEGAGKDIENLGEGIQDAAD